MAQADANIAAIRGRNADAEERRRAKAEKEEYDRWLFAHFRFVLDIAPLVYTAKHRIMQSVARIFLRRGFLILLQTNGHFVQGHNSPRQCV